MDCINEHHNMNVDSEEDILACHLIKLSIETRYKSIVTCIYYLACDNTSIFTFHHHMLIIANVPLAYKLKKRIVFEQLPFIKAGTPVTFQTIQQFIDLIYPLLCIHFQSSMRSLYGALDMRHQVENIFSPMRMYVIISM